MRVDISIIVPVFNVENYLERCIESILKQTFQNFEIILVNDGSTDNSRQVCDLYKKKDSRIQVIHKVNGGQSSARNLGLNIAKGEYIGFIDSDDYIKEDMYELLYNAIRNTNSDIAICGVIRVIDGVERQWLKPFKYKELTPSEALYHTLKGEYLNISPCNKLYKKSIFNNLRFKEGIIFEDFHITPMMFKECNKIVNISNCGYYYVNRSNSTMNNSNLKASKDIILVTEQVLEYIYINFPEIYPEILWPCLKRVWKWIGVIYCNENQSANFLFLIQSRKLFRHYIKKLIFDNNMKLQEKIGVITFCYFEFFCKLLYKLKKLRG